MLSSRRSSTSSTRSSMSDINNLSKNKKDTLTIRRESISEETASTKVSLADKSESLTKENNPQQVENCASFLEEAANRSFDKPGENKDKSKSPSSTNRPNSTTTTTASCTTSNNSGYRTKSTDYFKTNPITNYFNYNREVSSKLMDQQLENESEWVKSQFKKFNIGICTVDIIDFKALNLFKGTYISLKNIFLSIVYRLVLK